MKKVLSVLVAALMLAALCVPAFAAGEAVTMTADKTEAAIGETVKVTVSVAALSGLDATITYDTASYELVDVADAGLMTAAINKDTAGEVKYAGAAAAVKDGAVVTLTLKYLGGDGVIAIAVNEALDADDNDVAATLSAADVAITEAEETTVAPTTAAPTTAAPTTAATTKAAATTAATTVKNPQMGGSVSVAASAAAVVVMAAAVAYTMKKKDEE